jgi:hypothetical protein
MTPKRKAIRVRWFQRQVIGFVILTIALLGVIVYFSFSKTTIRITPKAEESSLSFELTIGPVAPSGAGETPSSEPLPLLRGTVLSTECETTQTFTGISETREEAARAGGKVTITNSWSRVQPLQAGTRLLSSGGVLFRTTERIDVPAGGKADVAVLADEPGIAGEAPPGRFEIVALWQGLKPLIYGESVAAFTGGTTKVSRITQQDLNTARASLLEQFSRDATALLEKDLAAKPEVTSTAIVAVLPNIKKERTNAIIGEEMNSFTYALVGTADGVAVNRSELNELIAVEAEKQIPADYRIVSLGTDEAQLTVVRVNNERQTATLKIVVTAQMVVRLSSSIFSREPLLGRDRQDIESHFSQFDEIERTDIHFSPFWVLRAPSLPDHIEIKLLEPTSE